MKPLILLDPDPASWGSECEVDLADAANEELTRLLEADGFDVEMNDADETVICADTDDERAEGWRAIEAHAGEALEIAIRRVTT